MSSSSSVVSTGCSTSTRTSSASWTDLVLTKMFAWAWCLGGLAFGLFVLPHLWQYQFWFWGGSLLMPTQCQWYQSSHESQPIIGTESSGLLHHGHIHTWLDTTWTTVPIIVIGAAAAPAESASSFLFDKFGGHDLDELNTGGRLLVGIDIELLAKVWSDKEAGGGGGGGWGKGGSGGDSLGFFDDCSFNMTLISSGLKDFDLNKESPRSSLSKQVLSIDGVKLFNKIKLKKLFSLLKFSILNL